MSDPMENTPFPDWVTDGIELAVNWRRRQHARKRRTRARRVRDGAITAVLDLMQKHGVMGRVLRPTCNICLYLLLIDQDLYELMTDATCAIGAERRKYVARHLAVLLWEASDDLSQLLSKEYRRSLSDFVLSQEWMDEFNGCVSRLGAFKRANHELLYKIRNMVAAHREKDAITQYEMMKQIDPLEIIRLGPDYQAAVDPLVPLMIKLMADPNVIRIAGEDYLKSMQNDTH